MTAVAGESQAGIDAEDTHGRGYYSVTGRQAGANVVEWWSGRVVE